MLFFLTICFFKVFNVNVNVTTAFMQADSTTNVWGIHVPTKHAAWVELVVISLVTPNASFVGHLAGILAGVLYCRLPSWGLPEGLGEGSGTAPPYRYTYASGYAASSSSSAAGGGGGGGAASGTASSSSGSSNNNHSSRRPNSNTSNNNNSNSYPGRTTPPPSAPPAFYQDGDELDVVWIDDIDVGTPAAASSSSAGGGSGHEPDAAEVRRRRLERFGTR